MSHYPEYIRLAAVRVWSENHHMSLTEALFFVLNNRSVTQ